MERNLRTERDKNSIIWPLKLLSNLLWDPFCATHFVNDTIMAGFIDVAKSKVGLNPSINIIELKSIEQRAKHVHWIFFFLHHLRLNGYFLTANITFIKQRI